MSVRGFPTEKWVFSRQRHQPKRREVARSLRVGGQKRAHASGDSRLWVSTVRSPTPGDPERSKQVIREARGTGLARRRSSDGRRHSAICNSPLSLLLFSFQKEREEKKSPEQSRGSWENQRPHRERRQPHGLVNSTSATTAHESLASRRRYSSTMSLTCKAGENSVDSDAATHFVSRADLLRRYRR